MEIVFVVAVGNEVVDKVVGMMVDYKIVVVERVVVDLIEAGVVGMEVLVYFD